LTDTGLSGLTHPEQVCALIEAGARFIQIREKSAPSDEFYRSVLDCLEIARATDAMIIVNDRVDIALASGAHGVHLGQKDLSPSEARKLLGEQAIIGISTHSIQQAMLALEMPVNYIAFGPVWPTSTKEDPDPVVGLGMLGEVKRTAGRTPVVAIGGINGSNLAATLGAGADSAAIISELYCGPEPIATRFQKLVEIASVKHL
jgi:thiamine-phosphate pyrophosphorylase